MFLGLDVPGGVSVSVDLSADGNVMSEGEGRLLGKRMEWLRASGRDARSLGLVLLPSELSRKWYRSWGA